MKEAQVAILLHVVHLVENKYLNSIFLIWKHVQIVCMQYMGLIVWLSCKFLCSILLRVLHLWWPWPWMTSTLSTPQYVVSLNRVYNIHASIHQNQHVLCLYSISIEKYCDYGGILRYTFRWSIIHHYWSQSTSATIAASSASILCNVAFSKMTCVVYPSFFLLSVYTTLFHCMYCASESALLH